MNTTVAFGRHPSIRRTATVAALAGLSILAAAGLPLNAQAATDGSCASGLAPIQTLSGPVCGTLVADTPRKLEAYRGMPYATAGRWQDPTPYGKWNGTLQADKFGPTCPQGSTTASQSEDCLSINVWRPQDAANLPVMVFIYGGAFIEGASASPLLNGAQLAASQNVVVVSFNYRLGALGFLAGSFADGGKLKGNFGFKDQQTALQWVHDNIPAFGGDDGNVTLFGESAGAMSVSLHLGSKKSGKLFQKAIMESNPFALPYKTLDEAGLFATTLEKALGCESGGLACMRKSTVTPAMILAAQSSKDVLKPAKDKGFVDFLVWAPILYDTVITGDPINGKIDKPVLLGTNLNEGNLFTDLIKSKLPVSLFFAYRSVLETFFGKTIAANVAGQYPKNWDATAALSNVLDDYIFTCANRYVASQATDLGKVWAYQFRPWTTYDIYKGTVPDCVQSSDSSKQSPICHGDELPYVFNSWKGAGVSASADEAKLTQAILGLWGSFAAVGAPGGTATWTAFGTDKNYLLLDGSPLTQKDPLDASAKCDFWNGIGYDLRKFPNTLFKSSR